MDSGSKKTKPQRRYIYIITDGTGASKIGIAENPKKRLSELQVGASVKLKLCYEIPVIYHTAAIIEKRIHKNLAHLHLKGEWFFVDPTVAANAVHDVLMGPEKVEENRASRWARDLWGTKVICGKCGHWRVIRRPKAELKGKKFRCTKCNDLIK